MADNSMSEFAAVFVEESGGRLKDLKAAVDALGASPAQGAESEKARISSHTIRGMAAQMGYEDIALVCKETELLFVELKKAGAAPSPEMIGAVKDCTQALEKMFAALVTGSAPGVEPQKIAARLAELARGIGAAI